jgi:hypothetical protein
MERLTQSFRISRQSLSYKWVSLFGGYRGCCRVIASWADPGPTRRFAPTLFASFRLREGFGCPERGYAIWLSAGGVAS